jgi:hypothetical protein
MNLDATLHIVNGDSAAGTLRMAHHFRRDRVLVNEDPTSVGPATFVGDLDSWRTSRQRFVAELYADWPDFSFDAYQENGLLANHERLAEPEEKLFWVGAGLADQLSVCWGLTLAHSVGAHASFFYVAQFEHLGPNQTVLGMGELSAERIKEYWPGELQLSEDRAADYRKAWMAYTNDDPSGLATYLESPARNPVLHRAMSSLVLRYPDTRSGLSYCDELILQYAQEKGPRAVRVVGHAIAYNESLDSLGDAYVYYRARRLARESLSRPLLQISGDANNMRSSEIYLTDFGREVLNGRANAIDQNGVDDWIGGVHLLGTRSLACREAERLVVGAKQ